MLGTSWEFHKVREFALRPMGDFLLVLVHIETAILDIILVSECFNNGLESYMHMAI